MNVQENEHTAVVSHRPYRRALWPLVHLFVIILIGVLLFWAASVVLIFDIHDDVAKYACYAVVFQQGMPALHIFPKIQCSFITHPTVPLLTNDAIVQFLQSLNVPKGLTQFVAAQSLNQPLHALPHEYPALMLIPFLLPLLAPIAWYHAVFAVEMLLVVAITYTMLVLFRSHGAALAFAFYLLAGAWSTAVGRFDLIPAALTLAALLFAVRSKWNWAFAMLALATLSKLYPVLLLVPFLIAQQKACEGKWYAWQRWSPLLTYIFVCLVIEAVSLALSVQGTLAPFSYFGGRPIQIESFSASILWVASFFGQKISYAFTFGSVNAFSALSVIISWVGTVLLVLGLLYTFWLQLRGKMDLPVASLLTLLIVIFTGKVFSPQYLIWVAPLVAYVGQSHWRWLTIWGAVSILTTIVYPFIYRMAPLDRVATIPVFYPLTTARNLLLLILIVSLLYSCARKASQKRKQSSLPLSTLKLEYE